MVFSFGLLTSAPDGVICRLQTHSCLFYHYHTNSLKADAYQCEDFGNVISIWPLLLFSMYPWEVRNISILSLYSSFFGLHRFLQEKPLCAPAGHQLWTISAIWCGPKTNNKKKKQLAKSCLKAPRRSQKWSSGWELSVGLSEHVTTFTLHIIWGLRSFVVLQRSTIIQVTISPFICSLRFSAPSGHFDDRLNRVIIVGNNCSAGEDETKLE